MGSSHEKGVLPTSECFYTNPSPLARELFFYITRFGHYLCTPQYILADNSAIAQLEGHRNFFLFYIKSGQLKVEFDNNTYEATAGQVGLINCRNPHRYYASTDLEYYWLHFDGPMGQRFYDRIVQSYGGNHVYNPFSVEQMEHEYKTLHMKLRGDQNFSEVDVSNIVSRILCHLLLGFSDTIHESSDQEVLSSIHYINENFMSPISVEDVAAQVNLSYSYFSRRFKAFTGYSIHDYITLRRHNEATHLLLTTNLPLKKIAASIGYTCESSFIVSFQSKQGCTPTQYRKNYTR